jgi:hypothetical protein
MKCDLTTTRFLRYIHYMANTIPTGAWTQYNLENVVDDRGHVYAKSTKACTGSHRRVKLPVTASFHA